VSNVIGPEFDWSIPQMENLIRSNINPFTGQIPSDGVGFATDLMASGDDGFLIRMRFLIAAGVQKVSGPWVQKPNTPALRQQIHDTTMAFFDGLAQNGDIPANPPGVNTPVPPPAAGGTPKGNQPSSGAILTQGLNYNVICDDSNNLFGGVATKTAYCDIQCRVFDNTTIILFRSEVGTNVQVQTSLLAA
jgi:hypothetical protein